MKVEDWKLLNIAALALVGFLMTFLILFTLYHQLQEVFPSFWEYLKEPSNWTYAGVIATSAMVIVVVTPLILGAIFFCKSKQSAKRML